MDSKSSSLVVVASIQGTHCHITIGFYTDKQDQRDKTEDCKPPSTISKIDADGAGIVDVSTCIRRPKKRKKNVSGTNTHAQIHSHANQALLYIEMCS